MIARPAPSKACEAEWRGGVVNKPVVVLSVAVASLGGTTIFLRQQLDAYRKQLSRGGGGATTD